MTLSISEKTRGLTKKCPSNFYCLTRDKDLMCDETKPMCTGEIIIEGNGLFIKPSTNDLCPYLIPFGFSFICNCPTRIEIYTRYNQ